MLTQLQLNNFKIWQDTQLIRLAPLTLLLGTNSSGKSSLIQSLLLIRQTVKADDSNLDLNFGNPETLDSVTLGQFKDVLCRQGKATETIKSNQIGIEFRWSENGVISESSVFSARYRQGTAGSAELDFLRLGKDAHSFIVQRHKAEIYRLWLGNERKPIGQSASFRPQRSFAFSSSAIAALGNNGELIKNIGPELLDELSKIIYLGPVRRLAQRDYIWEGKMPAHIGDDGAKAVDALIASGIAKQQAEKQKKPLPPQSKLFTNTIEWLKKMNLATGLLVKSLGGSARYELLIENNGELSNLKDVGVGVSQVLPVIVAALFAKSGHIVIVEEPESHLHPLAQTELAELFATISRERKVQFIIESHSEHFLNRLQRRVAEGVIESDDIAAYFCRRENSSAELEPLRLNIFGEIENWPDNFFGDEMADIAGRTLAAMQRKREIDQQSKLK